MAEFNVLVVEDDPDLGAALCESLQGAGYGTKLATDGEAALACIELEHVDLVLSDVQMQPMDGLALLGQVSESYPDLPIVLMTAYGSVEKAVAAMEQGASTYLVKPFDAPSLLSAVSRCLPSRHESGDIDTSAAKVVAGDPLTRDLLSIASRVAASDATVLLSGESGTGKEVFARFIHQNSLRSEAPFVAINCAAIPENMLEAVLFGHEKGAFTGATASHSGKFEQANGGTLLLDEISEMPLALQAKLLRVLQEREVERLGGSKSIPLDVRVLATTNRNLAVEVREKRFREDLFYRLNVFPLHIPPLRDRRGDILPLVRHLLAHYCKGKRALPELTEKAQCRLMQHGWPGNVRELENLVQRLLVLLNRDRIAEADLVFQGAEPAEQPERAIPVCATSSGSGLQEDLRKAEFQLIANALQEGAGNREAAARMLGISGRTLRHKIARLREAGLVMPRVSPHSTAALQGREVRQ
ncbi:MAG: sigma-54 dependent transcriptional regulator [Pseudomonadota bacterium]